ncbi:MAG: 50S ribosomal protein L18 [Desulfococcaceae bacterium]
MGSQNPKRQARIKRKKRIRKRLTGTSDRPRLSVFRSAKHMYAQVIDDTRGETLVAASTLEADVRNHPDLSEAAGKRAAAEMVGKVVAERAKAKGVTSVVFDRNGFLYHGRVKAVSDGAREAGLNF